MLVESKRCCPSVFPRRCWSPRASTNAWRQTPGCARPSCSFAPPPSRCWGATTPAAPGSIAVRSDLVVTAAHCVASDKGIGADAQVVTSKGTRAPGKVVALSTADDVAVILLPMRSRCLLCCLETRDRRGEGDEILYLGRQVRGRAVQRSEVNHRGACPDLPAVTDAVFASYLGVPGDSGAPLLGRDGVVGIVHSGQRCQIAMPSSRITPVVRRALDAARERGDKR